MERLFKILVFSFFLFSAAFSCSKESNDIKVKEEANSLNPNGDSELAILMRQMYEEAEVLKAQIENDEEPSISISYDELLTANATEPKKAESDTYKAFANAHIQNMELLKDTDPSKRLNLYNTLVNNCLNCHKEHCPGPIIRIKKLKLSEKEI